MSDPDGRYVRLVHAYRRTPLVNVALVCRDPRATAAALSAVFGLKQIPSSEPHLGFVPSGETGSESAAGAVKLLSGGPAPGTTTLACVPASFVDRWPARPASVTKLLAAVPGPVVHVRLAGSLGEARTALSALGWPATDVSPSVGGAGGLWSFTCCDADDNTFEVVGGVP